MPGDIPISGEEIESTNAMSFRDIISAVEKAIKMFKGSKEDLIKETINMIYLNEILTCDVLHPLFWLVDFDDSLKSVAPATITGITQANPAVVTTSAAHGLVESRDIVSLYDIVGMTELNNRMFMVGTCADTTHFQLKSLDYEDIDSSNLTAYSSGGKVNHRGKSIIDTKNVQKILSANWIDEDRLNPITLEEIENNNSYTNDNTGMPDRFYQRKSFKSDGTEFNQILWFSAADAAYDLRYWFTKRASKLINDTDVPNLPFQFHYSIVAGAIMRLAEFNIQVENQMVWPELYKFHLNAIQEFNRAYYDRQKTKKAPYLL